MFDYHYTSCHTCRGTGKCRFCDGKGEKDCIHCRGTGKITKINDWHGLQCDVCGGTGYGIVGTPNCWKCGGSGRLRSRDVDCTHCRRGKIRCSYCADGRCRECNGKGKVRDYRKEEEERRKAEKKAKELREQYWGKR